MRKMVKNTVITVTFSGFFLHRFSSSAVPLADFNECSCSCDFCRCHAFNSGSLCSQPSESFSFDLFVDDIDDRSAFDINYFFFIEWHKRIRLRNYELILSHRNIKKKEKHVLKCSQMSGNEGKSFKLIWYTHENYNLVRFIQYYI